MREKRNIKNFSMIKFTRKTFQNTSATGEELIERKHFSSEQNKNNIYRRFSHIFISPFQFTNSVTPTHNLIIPKRSMSFIIACHFFFYIKDVLKFPFQQLVVFLHKIFTLEQYRSYLISGELLAISILDRKQMLGQKRCSSACIFNQN